MRYRPGWPGLMNSSWLMHYKGLPHIGLQYAPGQYAETAIFYLKMMRRLADRFDLFSRGLMPPYPLYDKCRRPRGGAPAAASTPFSRKPNLPRRAPRGALRRGAHPISRDYNNFIAWVRT